MILLVLWLSIFTKASPQSCFMEFSADTLESHHPRTAEALSPLLFCQAVIAATVGSSFKAVLYKNIFCGCLFNFNLFHVLFHVLLWFCMLGQGESYHVQLQIYFPLTLFIFIVLSPCYLLFQEHLHS